MSLNIYVDGIKDESLHYQVENGENVDIALMAKNIGFWSIAIDIGRLDEQHIDEWFARYEILSALGVNFFIDGEGNDVKITYEDLVAHLGLVTNVTTRTRFSWLKQQVGGRMDDAIRDRKRELERKDRELKDEILRKLAAD